MPPKKSKRTPPLPRRLLASYVRSLTPQSLSALAEPASLSAKDLAAVLGVLGTEIEGKVQCPYAWADTDDQEAAVQGSTGKNEKAKGKSKPAIRRGCDENGCLDDPRCLNHLGQAKWQADGAFAAFKAAAGLRRNPSKGDRDPDLPVGLRNLAATCYANSLLQCWFQCLPLRAAVHACALPAHDKVDESPLFQLQRTFAALQLSNKAVYDPEPLIKSLKLDTREQQDSQEFAKLFMNLLDQEFRKQADTKVQNLIADKFEGKIKYGTRCLACKQCSERETSFLELEVNLARNCTLESQLQLALESEVLEGNNQYRCGRCDKLRDAERYTQLLSLPPVLHISVLRFTFDFDAMERKKSRYPIDFPVSVDMRRFLSSSSSTGEEEMWYDVRGVLLHKGSSAHHGHYVAQAFDVARGKWYTFDDENVAPIATFDVAEGGPVIIQDAETPRKIKTYGKASSQKTAIKDKEKPAEAGRIKTNHAYMLIYTRRPPVSAASACSKAESTHGSTSKVSETPPPAALAAAHVEKMNQEQTTAKRKWIEGLATAEADFKVARRTKRKAWKVLEPAEDADYCLVSRTDLKKWMTEGLEKHTSRDSFIAVESTDQPNDVNKTQAAGSDGPRLLEMNGHKRRKEIGNRSSQCEHDRPDPRRAHDYVRISLAAKVAIQNPDNKTPTTSGLTFLAPSDFCDECSFALLADERYAVEHEVQVCAFTSAKQGQDYWISKTWLEDWLKPVPEMHQSGQLDDPSPAGKRQWKADILCQHRMLQPDASRRVAISAEAATLLHSLFPAWIALDASAEECEDCRETFKMEVEQATDAKASAGEEKRLLRALALGNPAKLAQYMIEASQYALLDTGWLEAWKAYVQRPQFTERPGPVNNRALICCHDLCVVDVFVDEEFEHTDRFCVVDKKDWDKILQLYPSSGPSLIFTRSPSKELASTDSLPNTCEPCRGQLRRAFVKTRVSVRVLDPTVYHIPTAGAIPVCKDGTRRERSPSPEPLLNLAPRNGKKRKASPSSSPLPLSSGSHASARKSRRLQQASSVKRIEKMVELEVGKQDSVTRIKVQLQEILGTPTIYQHLYFAGRERDNEETVEAMEVLPGSQLEMLADQIDDNDFDTAELSDVEFGHARRKNRRPEGFAGSGLVGFATSSGAEDGAGNSGGQSLGSSAPTPIDQDTTTLDSGVFASAISPANGEDEEVSWKCESCTLINSYEFEKCEACGRGMT